MFVKQNKVFPIIYHLSSLVSCRRIALCSGRTELRLAPPPRPPLVSFQPPLTRLPLRPSPPLPPSSLSPPPLIPSDLLSPPPPRLYLQPLRPPPSVSWRLVLWTSEQRETLRHDECVGAESVSSSVFTVDLFVPSGSRVRGNCWFLLKLQRRGEHCQIDSAGNICIYQNLRLFI